jgi:RNase P subunit RPR2
VAAWVEAARHARPRQSLQSDEAFCVKCNHPVKLTNPTRTPRSKHLLLSGTCPECGTSIHRGVRHG